MCEFKMLTWNIRQGGKREMENILASLLWHDADLIVLTEFRENAAGVFLMREMKAKGWHHVISSNPPGRENGLLILSKYHVESHTAPYMPARGGHRWETLFAPSLDLYLLGVHIPNVNETYSKESFWEGVTCYAEKMKTEKAVMLGDFNTAMREEKRSAPLKFSKYIDRLIQLGWVDTWKKCHPSEKDYTWYSTKQNGFRLDYIFLSDSLNETIVKSELSQKERLSNYSDHALVIAELDCASTPD